MEILSAFYWKYTYLCPFETGNHQILQMILLKECLKHELMPFVIQSRYEREYGQILMLEEQVGVGELCKFFSEEQHAYENVIGKFSGV